MVQLSRRRILGGMVASGALAHAGTRKAAAAEGPIRIGAILPLSGGSADNGADIRVGAEIAVAQANAAGGALGRPIELVFRDTRGSANDSITYFRELTATGITLFIGGIYTAEAYGLLPMLDGANSLLVSPAVASLAFTHEAFVPNFFRFNTNSFTTYQTYGKLLSQHYPDITSWAMVLPDNAQGTDNYNQMKSGLENGYGKIGKKVTVVDPLPVKVGAVDMKNQIAALMASPAEGAFNCLAGADIISFYSQGRAFGWQRKIKVLCDAGYEMGIIKALGRNVPHNVWSATSWYFGAHPENPISAALYKGYVERTKDTLPRGWVARGYGPVKYIIDALRQAGNTDTAALRHVLETATFEGPTGKFRFRTQDHQSLCELGYIRMGQIAEEPGWKVLEYAGLDTAELVEPASPGKEFKG